jgi:hypothetical protein
VFHKGSPRITKDSICRTPFQKGKSVINGDELYWNQQERLAGIWQASGSEIRRKSSKNVNENMHLLVMYFMLHPHPQTAG